MACKKLGLFGMRLFEDDGTPIRWEKHCGNIWNCGHVAAENGIDSNPFLENNPFGLCWREGHTHCMKTGNRTPAGRKRKATKPDVLVKHDGMTVGVIGNHRELIALTNRTGWSLHPDDGRPHQTIRAESVDVLLDALAQLAS